MTFRSLVLTAGFGIRLRPLTWSLPKPLLPVCGQPLVAHTLRRLHLAGCEGAVLNLHHLPDAIPAQLGDDGFGMPLRYSREDPILGTLGALRPPREYLAAADTVLVVNGDTLCPWPVSSVLRRHQRSGADVTLLLVDREPDPALGGGIAVDQAGRVVQLRDYDAKPPVGSVSRRVFAGLHLLRPELLERVPEGPGDIIEGLYQPLLEAGADLRAVVTRRSWHDLGTPARYLEAVLELAASSWEGRLRRGLLLVPGAQVAEDAEVRRSVVEAGAVIESRARIERSLIMAGASIGAGTVLRRVIVGPGVRLSAGSEVEGRLLSRQHSKHALREGESQLGGLIYTPI